MVRPREVRGFECGNCGVESANIEDAEDCCSHKPDYLGFGRAVEAILREAQPEPDYSKFGAECARILKASLHDERDIARDLIVQEFYAAARSHNILGE